MTQPSTPYSTHLQRVVALHQQLAALPSRTEQEYAKRALGSELESAYALLTPLDWQQFAMYTMTRLSPLDDHAHVMKLVLHGQYLTLVQLEALLDSSLPWRYTLLGICWDPLVVALDVYRSTSEYDRVLRRYFA